MELENNLEDIQGASTVHNRIVIEVLDPVESRISTAHVHPLVPIMQYRASYWKKGPFNKIRAEYDKSLFHEKTKDYWYFYTGLIPRLKEYSEKKLTKPIIIVETAYDIPTVEPKLRNITLRTHQKELIQKALKHKRGVLKAPARSGKTVVQIGIASALRDYNILVLAHTVDIVNQTAKEFKEKGFFDGVQIVGGKAGKPMLTEQVVIATMQSFIKLNLEDYQDYFVAILVDEAHHVSKFDGTYGKILQQLLAPIRLGFTATTPEKLEAKYALEGLIGPVVGELTIEEAVKREVIAKPKIRIIKTPFSQRLKDIRNYMEAYEEGIVYNELRNRLILKTASDYVKEGKSVLILVVRTEHGKTLASLASEYFTKRLRFLYGATDEELRLISKDLLKNKSLKCLITSVIWKEGVDVPSLDVVVNAAGGKSEIATIQSVSRSLTRTKEKEEGRVVDFFDPSNRFFVDHFGHRLSTYMDNGWEFTSK